MRRAARRDLAEPDIVDALIAVGAEVWRLTDIDLLVAFRGRWQPLEVKTSAKEYRTKPATRARQQEHRDRAAKCGCASPVVTSPEEALRAVGAMPREVS